LELPGGEGPHALVEREARRLALVVDLHEGLGPEAVDQAEDRLALEGVVPEDGFGGVPVEATLEDRRACEGRSLGGREVLPRQRERMPKRSVSSLAFALEEGEAIVDAREELARRQDPHPRGGQLDRERQAVQPLDELADGFDLAV